MHPIPSNPLSLQSPFKGPRGRPASARTDRSAVRVIPGGKKRFKRGTDKLAVNVPMETVRQMELKAGENVRITIQKIETGEYSLTEGER